MTTLGTQAVRVLAAALIGFGMITPVAAVLLEWDRRVVRLEHVDIVIAMALFYALGLPLVGWAALHLVTIRPAFAAALLGQVLLIPVLLAFNQPGGFHRPPWQYGLQGALAYGFATVTVITADTLGRRWRGIGESG